jgi:hypothetical protein
VYVRQRSETFAEFLYEDPLYGLGIKILKIGRIELFTTVMSLWGFLRAVEYLEQLNKHYLLKKDAVAWS